MTFTITHIEEQLDSFSQYERLEALQELIDLANDGKISFSDVKNEVNLHFHTFFSFNANNWSPSRIAWEAKKYGLSVVGIVDFDVLDGLEEFFEACKILNTKCTVSMETRVFIKEYSEHVINSPNEPGISYFMAGGCYKVPKKDSEAYSTLAFLKKTATDRNLQVIKNINLHYPIIAIDYQNDVLPLTPSDNATERHLLAAYDNKSNKVFCNDKSAMYNFWAETLGISIQETKELLSDTPKFRDTVRNKLMKFGGVGYVAPDLETFPSIENVSEMAIQMGAIPTATWLDGTNSGEADMKAMLELLKTKGVSAMNIVPDRNWNIKNPQEKAVKVENLGKAVDAARELNMPIIVGTEMNKAGLPFVDNFSAPELIPYIDDFMKGAFFLWGHTIMAKNNDMGYQSEWAKSEFSDEKSKNEFYTEVGRLTDPSKAVEVINESLNKLGPKEILEKLS